MLYDIFLVLDVLSSYHGGTNSVGRIAFWKEKKGYMIPDDSNATLTP